MVKPLKVFRLIKAILWNGERMHIMYCVIKVMFILTYSLISITKWKRAKTHLTSWWEPRANSCVFKNRFVYTYFFRKAIISISIHLLYISIIQKIIGYDWFLQSYLHTFEFRNTLQNLKDIDKEYANIVKKGKKKKQSAVKLAFFCVCFVLNSYVM